MVVTVGNSTVSTTISNSAIITNQTNSYAYATSNRNSIRPSLVLDFARSQTVDPRITFTRASSATYFNSLGVLTTAANNVPRIDYDPVTGSCNGLLIEEARTNYVRNGYGSGGTSSVLPTYWSAPGNGSVTNGLTLTYIGPVVNQGIPAYRFTVSGTATASGAFNFRYENGGGISGLSSNITFQQSIYAALVSGTTAGITFTHWGQIADSTLGGIIDNQPVISISNTITRFIESQTTPTAANSSVTATITSASWSSGVVTCIGTGFTFTNVGNSRKVQISGSGTIDGTYTVSSLTGSTQFTFALASNPGIITVPCTVTWNIPPFSCTSASVLIYYNNAATINATFDIGCGQQEIGYMPTSFIATTGATATRAVETCIYTPSVAFPTSGTLLTEYLLTSTEATGGPFRDLSAMGSDSSNIIVPRTGTSNTIQIADFVSNVLSMSYSSLVSAPVNQINKFALTYSSSLASTLSVNGGTIASGTASAFPTMSNIYLSTYRSGQINGYYRKISFYPVVLSNAEITTLTTL